MTEQWRILVVEDEEQLNQSIVSSLHKDGYVIQGARSGAEAIRMLWSEEFDVVIGDLKTPGADGFELLQWLRTYRPHTRMIMVAAASANSSEIRTRALEAGVVSYLEKPLNLHLLKEELRRLLQQTGFSANLDSFDLLDVIQIVTMSRKNIALLVNIGLEERGTLRFQGGELIWAEYGLLRGEEAFFALAAYKNGTVMYQPLTEQITPNVMQPLSRLIFQALQYRAKYAVIQQITGEQMAITREPQLVAAQSQVASMATTIATGNDIDDSPMRVLVEDGEPAHGIFDAMERQPVQSDELLDAEQTEQAEHGVNALSKEWWQQTDKHPDIQNGNGNGNGNTRKFPGPVAKTPVFHPHQAPTQSTNTPAPNNGDAAAKAPGEDLPSWLMEQPSHTEKSNLRPSALSTTAQIPAMPVVKPHPASEWRVPAKTPRPASKQTTQPVSRTTEPIAKDAMSPGNAVTATGKVRRAAPPAPPEWQPPVSIPATNGRDGLPASGSGGPRPAKRNYAALVAALQTLGYSIHGFIAAAVVSMDGQPIAQVAIDDLDFSQLCKSFSMMLQGALQSLEQQQWGDYQRMVITSTDRHILLNIVGDARNTFQVLITTREADPAESLEVLQNVEGAIGAALK